MRVIVIYINLNVSVITAQKLQLTVSLKQDKLTQSNYACALMTLIFLLSNIHSVYVFHFINSNSYQLITSKKISSFTTLQYCTKPDRFKHKTKFRFSGSILWQVSNQFLLARNCMVLAQIENKMFRVRVSCLNNSSIIVSTFFLLNGLIRQERQKTSTILEYKNDG